MVEVIHRGTLSDLVQSKFFISQIESTDEMSIVHGSRFKFDCAGDAVGIWGCDGIRRAVENLIGNAVKYGAPGTLITVSLKRANRSAEVCVHNLGAPIPEKEIPLLFQQYRRSKMAQESTKTGWGLGLTLVKGVVDAHGGHIRVESNEKSGTSFILEIPEAAKATENNDSKISVSSENVPEPL